MEKTGEREKQRARWDEHLENVSYCLVKYDEYVTMKENEKLFSSVAFQLLSVCTIYILQHRFAYVKSFIYKTFVDGFKHQNYENIALFISASRHITLTQSLVHIWGGIIC